MPLTLFRRALIAIGLAISCWSLPAHAQTYGSCTVAAANASIGSVGSFTVASTAQHGSGASGMSCSAISVATTSYLKARLVSSTFLLTGPGGRTIPFSVSATSSGTAMTAGSEVDLSSFDLLALFAGPGGTVPLYFSTTATGGLAAGTYNGTVNLRWYFSVCTLGVAVCLVTSESPGFARPGVFPINWGAGVPVTVTVSLTVSKDCLITAPNIDFGSAPLVSRFNPVTRTISIRCSADTSYTVGLSNGANFDNGWRRMRRDLTSDYLRYEIYQATTGIARWGSSGAERRSSAAADQNAGTYDAVTLQGYSFRAVIEPTQATPTQGTYLDTIILDVTF
jgi:spore coat protein U-like protein